MITGAFVMRPPPDEGRRPMRGGAPRRVLVVCCDGWSQPPPHGQPAAGPGEFAELAGVVEDFCPQVEELRPGVCAISVRGPARYFGGEGELARKISEAVTGRGLHCRVGIADGMFAALLAAGAVLAEGLPSGGASSGTIVPPGGAAAFLAPFPVAALGLPEFDELLPRLGITTLGQFAALPAAEAANRFGTQGARAHRLARGLDPRLLVPRPPAADLSVQQEFTPSAEQSEPVVFVAKGLADQLHARLAASGLACVRIKIQVFFEDGQEVTRLWRHDGLLSALAVAERVRWQLDGWQPGRTATPATPGRPAAPDGLAATATGWAPGAPALGAPVIGAAAADSRVPGLMEVGGITLLRLAPEQLVRDQGRQLGLWGDAVVSDRVARAAVRVQAMLGHQAVTRPVLAGGRSPAEQVLMVPFGDMQTPLLPADRNRDLPWPGKIPAPAPATVYPAPRPAMITDSSGALVTVTGRGQTSGFPAWLSPAGQPALAIAFWAGPWPVTERWWDPYRASRRARFQLVTEDGTAWLAVVQDGRWLIEASYD